MDCDCGRSRFHTRSETTRYEIRIRDVLGEKWAVCFAPFLVVCGAEDTLITGETHDQAELYGLLLKIRDLGLRLVSVNPVVVIDPAMDTGANYADQGIGYT
jgi:hypothetical protein